MPESGEQSFPDGYRKLDPARIFHVHLRDYKHQDGKVVWARVGDGEFDNLGQIRALLKDGYKGTFTLETHWARSEGQDVFQRAEPEGAAGSNREEL